MFLKKIIRCARCGEDHINIESKKLTLPVMDYSKPEPEIVYTHWAPCPTNGEPILVVEVGKDGKITLDTGDAS